MVTIADRRNNIERKAVSSMQSAFYFYEKAAANFWDTRYHGWIARADRYAKSAEMSFEIARKRKYDFGIR